jgi:hypothetical protein
MQYSRMILIRLLPTIAAAAGVAALPAQVVSPRVFTRTDGNSSALEPLASTTALYRYLQVHDDVVGQPRTITGLGFRLHACEDTGAITLQNVTVLVSEAAPGISSANLSSTFAGNHGQGLVSVTHATVNLPAVPACNSAGEVLPRPFTHRLPCAPFTYAGTQPLVWELQIGGRQNQGVRGSYDRCTGQNANPDPLLVRYLDRTCRISTGEPTVQLILDPTSRWQNAQPHLLLTYGARNLESGQLAVTTLAASRPVAPLLLPGSSTAPSGPCYLAANFDFLTFGGVAVNGVLSASTSLPLAPEMHGATVFCQTLGVAPIANPLRLVSSDAIYMQIRRPYGLVPVSLVTARGSLAATGTVQRNAGLIVRFEP